MKKYFLKLLSYCKNSKNIESRIVLSVHIGSQILDHKPYAKMLKVIDKIIGLKLNINLNLLI